MSFYGGSETEEKPAYGSEELGSGYSTKPAYGEDNAGSGSYETSEEASGYGGKVDTEQSSYDEKPSSYEQDTPSSYESEDSKPSSYTEEESKPSSYDEEVTKPSSYEGEEETKSSSYEESKPSSYEDDVKPSSYEAEEDTKPSSYDETKPTSYEAEETVSSYEPEEKSVYEETTPTYQDEPSYTSEDKPSYQDEPAYKADTSDVTAADSDTKTYGTTDTTAEDVPAAEEDEGLSTGEKIAIGVGATAGVVAAGAAGYAIYEHFNKDDEEVPVANKPDSTNTDEPATTEDEAPPKKSSWF